MTETLALTYFFPMLYFHTPWKHQKAVKFSIFRRYRNLTLERIGLNRATLNEFHKMFPASCDVNIFSCTGSTHIDRIILKGIEIPTDIKPNSQLIKSQIVTIVPATVGSADGSNSELLQSCMEKVSSTTLLTINWSKTGVTLLSGYIQSKISMKLR